MNTVYSEFCCPELFWVLLQPKVPNESGYWNLHSPVFFYYTSMLEIKNLHASVADTEILHGIDVLFEKGKNTCILGKNGSGKSSLASIIMGNPAYEVTE